MEIKRYISFYDKKGENHIGDFNIDNLDLDFLKLLFNPPEKDPLLYDVYEIDEKLSLKLQEKVDFTFDFDKYDYFLECFQK